MDLIDENNPAPTSHYRNSTQSNPPQPRYLFTAKRYARVERWNGQTHDISRSPSTEVEVSVFAENQEQAIAKIESLSGPYTGPASSLFNGRESVNHGWVIQIVSVTEVDNYSVGR